MTKLFEFGFAFLYLFGFAFLHLWICTLQKNLPGLRRWTDGAANEKKQESEGEIERERERERAWNNML